MTDELENHGLFKLPPEVRAKALAGMGITEAEYREKLATQLARNDAEGHGWSTKEENPGWSDETVHGEVVSPAQPAGYSDEVVEFLDELKNTEYSGPRMLTQREIELSRQHAKESGAIAREKLKAMGIKPVKR